MLLYCHFLSNLKTLFVFPGSPQLVVLCYLTAECLVLLFLLLFPSCQKFKKRQSGGPKIKAVNIEITNIQKAIWCKNVEWVKKQILKSLCFLWLCKQRSFHIFQQFLTALIKINFHENTHFISMFSVASENLE